MIQETLAQLMKQKDQMQKTLAKLTEQIEQIDKIKHFDQGVIDREGFPRQDLDFGQLANYRNLKRRKAELNNDHVKLMKEIESKLFEYHATLPKVSPEQQEVKTDFRKEKKPQQKAQNNMEEKQVYQKKPLQNYVIQYLTPFAKITLVEPNSPADLGGMKVNDLLSQFASVIIYTPDNIKQIPYHVKENQELKVVVLRPVTEENKGSYEKVFRLKDDNDYAKLELKLTPQRWSGKGLLGCKIDPF